MALPIGLATLIGGAVSSMLYAIVGHIVGRVLVSLGFGYITYLGLDALADWVLGQLVFQMGTLPANLVIVLALIKVPAILSMYVSAYVASFAPDVLAPATFTKMIQRGSM